MTSFSALSRGHLYLPLRIVGIQCIEVTTNVVSLQKLMKYMCADINHNVTKTVRPQ